MTYYESLLWGGEHASPACIVRLDIVLDIDELVNPVTVYAIIVTGYPISRNNCEK